MLRLDYGKSFAKKLLLCEKRGLELEKLHEVVTLLQNGVPLPERCRDHALVNSKKYINARECHIDPNWLLIYRIYNDLLILELIDTGTHSDLFA